MCLPRQSAEAIPNLAFAGILRHAEEAVVVNGSGHRVATSTALRFFSTKTNIWERPSPGKTGRRVAARAASAAFFEEDFARRKADALGQIAVPHDIAEVAHP